jgi:hypothetical protein
VYGLYAACTEGIAKAWITRLVPAGETATAIGTYSALVSICALIASSMAGFIWYRFGAAYAFGWTACIAIMLLFYFIGIRNLSPVSEHDSGTAT